MKDSMKLTVAERNTLLELAHLLNEGLDRRATSPQRCGTPHAQAGGSTEPD
jgi:hypothetical protein